MTCSGDPCRAVHVDTNVPTVSEERFARVHADPHTDRARGQYITSGSRGGKRVRGSCEGDEERVPLRVHLDATVLLEAFTQRPSMLAERVRVRISELMEQPGRPLDVGEEKGDSAGGQLGHTGMMRRLEPKV